MRKIVVLLLFVLCTAAQSQSLTLFDIDTTAFPTIKAKFYAFDDDGKQIINFSPSDFEITENGVKRTVTSVSCPASKEPEALSSVLVFDISGSMCGSGLDIEKIFAETWINGLPLGKSECAITSFSDNSYINQDFSVNKNRLVTAINSIACMDGTDFDIGLLDSRAGGINIAKTGKNKRIIILLSDGWPSYEPRTDEIIKQAKTNNIKIYCITIGYSTPQCMIDFAKQTGGTYFDNVNSKEDAEKCCRQILKITQGSEPCTVEWTSGVACISNNIKVTAKIIAYKIEDNLTYLSPSKSIANLIIKPSSFYFKNIPLGTTKDTIITITAVNSVFNITNITSTNSVFSIDKTSFFLSKGQSITLKVSYTPIDSNYIYSNFNIETNLCDNSFFAIGHYVNGKITKKPPKKTLKLTHPNGGEEFVVGIDTLITWEGIPETDTLKLEFSNDNGITWQTITNEASGLQYIWKNIPRPASKQCLIRVKQFEPENTNKKSIPKIEWQKTYGGTNLDYANSIRQTDDGGYILAGYTRSNDGDITKNNGQDDFLIIKVNSIGNIEWLKSYGGSSGEWAYSIEQTLDGGYIVAGFTVSDDGDVTIHKALDDLWILKLNQEGEIEWQRTYGGSFHDVAHSIHQTDDGGYIVAGYSSSNDGDVTENKGEFDYWIFKLNPVGEIEWEKTFGGSDYDEAIFTQQTNDGGYIVAGYTDSNDGDITKNKGYSDYWIIKLNSIGEIEWQKTFGGSGDDKAYSIRQTNDGGYVVVGYTTSKDGKITENKGCQDYWIIKLNQVGEIEWQRTYGGSMPDIANSIQNTNDGGFIVAGTTESNDGDVTGNKGYNDCWIIKLNSIGEIEWEKTIGGSLFEQANSVQQTFDGGYIVAGDTYSNDGDATENKGDYDFWVIKLSPEGENVFQEDVSDSLFAIVAPQASANDIDMKQCLVGKAKDSVIKTFVSNIGTYKFRVDSIYFSGSDAKCFSLVSGFPQYELTPNASHQAEIHFVPNRVGIHSAQINVITQSDTLIKNIIGEGIEPKLQILTDLLDFGMIELGNEKIIKDTVLLKNISSSNITINNVVQLGPDLTQFEIIDGGGSFTLAPNEERKLTLKFKPKYGGRTSGQIGFEYSGAGSPAIARLFGTGIGGSVSVADDSAFVGEKLNLKLLLGNIKPDGLAEIAPNYEATVRFQNSILAPLNGNWSLVSDSIYMNISGTVGSSTNIAEIPVLAGLGTVEETTVDIVNFVFKDNSGNPIEYDVETVSGTFKLLGICGEGDKRLFYGSGKAGLLSIIPNPADDEVTLTINTIEEGETYIYIYNTLGMKIYKNIINSDASGKKEIKLNTSNYSAGVYYIKFQTPTWNEYNKLIIGR